MTPADPSVPAGDLPVFGIDVPLRRALPSLPAVIDERPQALGLIGFSSQVAASLQEHRHRWLRIAGCAMKRWHQGALPTVGAPRAGIARGRGAVPKRRS